MLRKWLCGLLGLLTIAAALVWWVPYDMTRDPAAGFRISAAKLTQDHEYFWLDLHLKKSGGKEHDLEKSVWLETADGRLEPADATFAKDRDGGISEIWYKFWLEGGDLSGPLSLHLNEGSLRVRAGSGQPPVGSGGSKVFQTKNW